MDLIEKKERKEGYIGEGLRTEVLRPHSFVGLPPPRKVGISAYKSSHSPSLEREDEMFSLLIQRVSKTVPSSENCTVTRVWYIAD